MFSAQKTSRDILSVSKLNRLARSILESEIGQVWLSGEISNFVAASSGHWYFSLKDNKAQIRAAMFRGANNRVKQRPKEGDKVLVRANISLYEPRGDYQLIVEHLEPEGEGALKRAFEELKLKLSGEGLFAKEYKKALPQQVQKVGVISSPTGAALQDILQVLARRNPAIEVIVYPAQVQGELAPAQLCQALQTANRRAEVDVIILGRGGGSIEDLNCFNDEDLARQIFASDLPIISAVGHEIDFTISDFVADMRAPTPSAAAELVSSDRLELAQQLANFQRRLQQQILSHIRHAQQQHNHLKRALSIQDPKRKVQEQAQALDRLNNQLHKSLQAYLDKARQKLAQNTISLQAHSPKRLVAEKAQQHKSLTQRLNQQIAQLLKQKQQQLANQSQLLHTVSPLATLGRGYSISFKGDEIVKSAKALKAGDILTTRLADGEVESQVLPSQDKLF